MLKLNERYVVNKKGKRVGVQLDMDEYQKVLEELEELESLRAYDAAKASGETSVPLEDALADLERRRT